MATKGRCSKKRQRSNLTSRWSKNRLHCVVAAKMLFLQVQELRKCTQHVEATCMLFCCSSKTTPNKVPSTQRHTQVGENTAFQNRRVCVTKTVILQVHAPQNSFFFSGSPGPRALNLRQQSRHLRDVPRQSTRDQKLPLELLPSLPEAST